ncbi:MAG: hypothetical protein R2752_22985 [Vicinamibacterales bacterium]
MSPAARPLGIVAVIASLVAAVAVPAICAIACGEHAPAGVHAAMAPACHEQEAGTGSPALGGAGDECAGHRDAGPGLEPAIGRAHLTVFTGIMAFAAAPDQRIAVAAPTSRPPDVVPRIFHAVLRI